MILYEPTSDARAEVRNNSEPLVRESRAKLESAACAVEQTALSLAGVIEHPRIARLILLSRSISDFSDSI